MLGLNIKLPVWQAPMAGVTTPELVAAACRSGVLGSIGAGYLSGEKTEEFIQRVKKQTNAPFSVNLFVPEPVHAAEGQVAKANELLAPYLEEVGRSPVAEPVISSSFEEQLAVVVQEKVEVCSFTFGLPPQAAIEELKNNGIITVGTATTVDEAKACEKAGMDAIVVQGSEAGGHRGTFQAPENMIGLMSLLPQVVQEVSVPVVAAGGLMNGQGVAAALCLGASAAQMGTAFLVTEESGAHPLHKEAVLTASETDLVYTKAFTGKTAQGLSNRFTEGLKGQERELPPYPLQHVLTAELRKKAGELNKKELMSLWSGQSPRLSRQQTVDELVRKLEEEIEEALFAANGVMQNAKRTNR